MTGNSNIYPQQVEMLKEEQYRVRWNIIRNDRATSLDGPIMESYDFEYNSKYLAKAVTKKEIMLAIIREKYDTPDEISISMKREDDVVKLQEHEDYVSFARTVAEQIMIEHEAI